MHQLFDCLGQTVERVLVHHLSAGLELEGPVTDFYRVGAAGDLDNGGRVSVGVGKMGSEAFRIDGCGGNDDLEIGALGQKTLEIAQ